MKCVFVAETAFEKHKDRNCYPGHGGDVLGNDPYHSSLSLDACKDACASDKDCEGIVFEQKEEGPCYKRKNLQPSNCGIETGRYNLFVKRK